MTYTELPIVLVVEDNPNDLLFIQRAATKANLRICLKTVSTGDEAVSYLLGEGSYADREQYPLPNIILTDTRMPRMGGLELVIWIKQQPNFQDLPIVVMSSSIDSDDGGQFTALGINLHFIKPVSASGFEEILRQVLLLLAPSQE
ncbi:response regulator [Scytonema sp. NUACC21]